MELTKDFGGEEVSFDQEYKALSDISRHVLREDASLSATLPSAKPDSAAVDLFQKVESILLERIQKGEKDAWFQLGLLYFEEGFYKRAYSCFDGSKNFDCRAMYQTSVMLYDGLGVEPDTKTALEYMEELATDESPLAKHLLPSVRFNIGRAYFQGYGTVRLSDEKALWWWLLAADDGSPHGSVKAQTMLGMFFSRRDYSLDLKKAFFWHTEACGNGSLESQGALGVMYMHGLGVKKDLAAAYVCLKSASDRGNIYAMATLVSLFYHHKLFSTAADLASKIAMLTKVELIARQTDCIPSYVRKGISSACFYYARCLELGLGLRRDTRRARKFYHKSFELDTTICAKLHNMTVLSVI